MKTKARVVNMEFFTLLILPITADHRNPLNKPKVIAKTNDFHILDRTIPTDTTPCDIPSNRARPTTRHRTSLSADSSIKTEEHFSPSFICFTMGMTTAEEVPPTIAPINTELNTSIESSQRETKEVMITVITKLSRVSNVAEPMAFFTSLKLRPDPLSNRITISVMVVKTLPSLPKKSLVIIPLTGPMMIPIKSSNNTFGILVLSNSSLKTCDRKMSNPKAIIVILIFIQSDYLLIG